MTRRTDPQTTRHPVTREQLPDFTPVPRQTTRHDGWTNERQLNFIEALADTGSVAAACKAVNMTTVGAYYLRRQKGAESFRKAWQIALDLGVEKIEDVAMDRALNGIEAPVYSYGELVGTRTVYNDRLLMFMLRNRAPERFAVGSGAKGLGGLNAIGKMEVKRLKKKWRKEWEAEQEAEQSNVSPAEIRASIERKVEILRKNVAADKAAEWEALSEETREAIGVAEQLKARDLALAGIDVGSGQEAMKALPPFPTRKAPREEEPEEETGPRVRRMKDDGWD